MGRGSGAEAGRLAGVRTLTCLQSERTGTDLCSVTARSPPWPRAPDPVPRIARRGCGLTPACVCPDPPPPELMHAALPASPSVVSPVPLTPLETVLSTTPVPGPCGEGLRCHREHRGPPPRGHRAAVPRGSSAATGWVHGSLLAAEISAEPSLCGRRPLPGDVPLWGPPPRTAPSFSLSCLRGSRTGLGRPAGAAPEPATK